jgi:hypothetical protein
MTVMEDDIAAFDRMRPELEANHFKHWVVFYHGALVDVFSDFEDAAATALERFDVGPYLIRQVGAPSAVQLPGGMVFTPAHVLNPSRV